MALPPDVIDEFRDYERLFGEHGWHRLVRTLEARVKTIKENALYTVVDEKTLYQHRGWVDILEEMIRLPDTVAAQKAQAEATAGPSAAEYLHEDS